MSVATALWTVAVLMAYTVGKGVGRAKERDELLPLSPVRLTLELSGDVIGTVQIENIRPTDADKLEGNAD